VDLAIDRTSAPPLYDRVEQQSIELMKNELLKVIMSKGGWNAMK
jgi:hypothetical protein